MLVHKTLKKVRTSFPQKVAVVDHKDRKTYLEIDRSSDVLAMRLVDARVKKGDRIALFLDNSSSYIIAFFGILKAGAAVVPINTQLISRELAHLINDCTPAFIITEGSNLKAFEGLIDPNRIFLIETIASETERFAGRFLNPPLRSNDLAMIIYTSGTTGKSKGVMLSHENLCANADSIIEYLHIQLEDKAMVILPFYYSFGTSLLTTHIKAGATLVIDNRFLYPNVVLETMEKEAVTSFAGVPSHYAILLRKSALRKYKLKALRYVTQAGGAMAPVLIEEFLEIFPDVDFFVMYGQTEATARLTYLDPSFLRNKMGSIGKAIPGVEIDVLNEQGMPVKPGETGEIVARGRNIMLGYWNAPEETEKVLRKEGLFTGDMARVDEDGFLYVVARKKEMIKSGANRISPLEIEEIVCRMPGVVECAAVGIPEEILGEAIKLFVVRGREDLGEKELMLFCKHNLATYKIPKYIQFVPSLPKTSSGKIKRAELLKGEEKT